MAEMKLDKEFAALNTLIMQRKNMAIGFLNYASVSTYWTIGAYVSRRIKSSAWGSKTVTQFEDYLKTRNPKLRGFSRRQIYNMVEFYDTYSSEGFAAIFRRLKLDEFVQPLAAQLDEGQIVQLPTAQMPGVEKKRGEIVQFATAQIGEILRDIPRMPDFLAVTTFTNHVEIMSYCREMEAKVFYILYAYRERLKQMDLRRSIINDTYGSVMSKEKKVSKALRLQYPDAEFMMKDRAFLDFLNLPKKHTEPLLRRKILTHLKDFILELGKDYLYMGNEYHVTIGGEEKRLDLLFYHRGLQCLVDVELKAVKFRPEFISKMDVYLEALDRDVKRPNENPSVGLLLCPSSNKFEVAYALDRTMSPIMVAEYERLLIPTEVLKKELDEYCQFIKDDVIEA